jgi:predicted transcriptional regulator
VSQLARDVGISRPLVHVHLQRLEAAGLVTGHLELSGEGKAMKFFEVNPFALNLTPETVAERGSPSSARTHIASSQKTPLRRSSASPTGWTRRSPTSPTCGSARLS